MAVKSELERLGLKYISVELGEVEIIREISSEQRIQLDAGLKKTGLELMDSRKSILIEKIKILDSQRIDDDFELKLLLLN